MTNNQRKVLGICTTAIGDLMFCTPAIAALGREFHLDMLCHQHRIPLLAHNSYIKSIFPYRNNNFVRYTMALRLMLNRYHYVAVLHANDDIFPMLRLMRYEKAFNAEGWNIPSLKMEAVDSNDNVHFTDRPLLVAQACGAKFPDSPPALELYLTDDELAEARNWLLDKKLDFSRPIVGLVIGASQPVKRWPIEKFIKLGEILQNKGVQLVVIASAAEMALLDSMASQNPLAFVPALNLEMRQLAALTASLNMLITNDTGPLHLAAAFPQFGVKTLSLFGPTDPYTHIPRVGCHQFVYSGVKTATSYQPGAMEDITLEAVLNKALAMLFG